MKILYGARMARYDLVRAGSSFATTVAQWMLSCDQDLHRLVAYINSTLARRLVSWSATHPPSCPSLCLPTL
eukprot:2210269-Prorocentrum_lima.AAC.1